jgi:NAD(P)-dependent dehydrogenase (short-subunit alcohol dehydrogenase family)
MRTFGPTSTADDVLSGLDLRGKRILVTGVSSGLGVETARSLAAHGAWVVGTARDLVKAESAVTGVRSGAARGGGLSLIELDLASMADVRRGADSLAAQGFAFDVVIANAGVMAVPQGRTVDGFETHLATNHLGHFVLVNRLAPLIAKGGRVVVVASAAHRSSDFTLDDLNFERTPYDARTAYARSKTANVLFAVEFDRRHQGRGVRAAAVHPGSIRTELGRHMGQEVMDQAVLRLSADLEARGEPPFQWKSVPQGAATSVWAAIVAAASDIGGRYCEDCHVSAVVDGPVHPLAEGVSPYALDSSIARQLWRKSEELVGETFRAPERAA